MEVIAVIRDHLQENENVKPNMAFLEELRNKLPEFFNDEGFDIEKFQNALKENNINEFSDGYQLNFIGKDYARKQAGNAPTSVIVPDNEHNQKEENKNSKNLFFTGDNLEVLRHLRNNYSNKIDVIYIDPPYNTGKDDFVYPDKFEYSDKQLEEILGMSDEDVSKLDALKGSKSHSAWLTFMYPRLWLAKQLLTEDGIILVSIDDNELSNLKIILNEIFGEENNIATLIWNSSTAGGIRPKHFTINHQYILAVAKDKEKVGELKAPLSKKAISMYNSENEKGRYRDKDFAFKNTSTNPSQKYEILTPDGTKIHPKNGYIVRFIRSRFEEELKKGNVTFKQTKNGPFLDQNNNQANWNVYIKKYLGDAQGAPATVLPKENVGLNNDGSKEINNLFNNIRVFNNPKSTRLLKYLLNIFGNNNAHILDFFAGSATTADAVMQLNAEDGGNRKFIMVQLPEKTYVEKNKKKIPTKGGKAAFEAGYKSIDEISRERIKRAAKKIKDENPDLSEDFDGGFKHYRVVSPEKETLDKIYDFDPENYELVSDMVESFSSSALGVPGNASGEDTILTTWLAEDGYDLNTHNLVEYDFAGYRTFGIKDTRLYLIDNNWHSEQTKELLNQLGTNKVKFQSVVVYGYSFNVMDMKELDCGLLQLNSKVELIKRY
nr:site-specific DNA-methyltransferase [Ligilactobacillus aviarius]